MLTSEKGDLDLSNNILS